MKFSSRASGVREAIVAGVFTILLLAGCCLLVTGLKHSRWLLTAAFCLIEAAYAGAQWFTGGKSRIESFLKTVRTWVGRSRERRAGQKALQRQASRMAEIRLAYVEERVNELVELGIAQRLAELERAEKWRNEQEWTELRDVWRALILDPKTPEELRHSCREWLAKYPETLDFLARRLTRMGLLQENDVLIEENWEQRAQHKWRVQ